MLSNNSCRERTVIWYITLARWASLMLIFWFSSYVQTKDRWTMGTAHSATNNNYFTKRNLQQKLFFIVLWIQCTANRQKHTEHLQRCSSAQLRSLRDDLQLLHTFVEVNNPVNDRRAGRDGIALPHLRNHACISASTRLSSTQMIACDRLIS